MAGAAKQRLIVGISGASGVIYGVRLMEMLRDTEIEVHLVISRAGAMTIAYELDRKVADVRALADVAHPIDDVAASIASGSFQTLGMIVAPCSVRTLAGIATGATDNLLCRAADVVLKERRRLVLMLRETPLHLGHIRNMAAASEMGAIVAPPAPAFYISPESIDEIVDYSVCRVLDLYGVEVPDMKRWGEHLPAS